MQLTNNVKKALSFTALLCSAALMSQYASAENTQLVVPSIKMQKSPRLI